MSVDTLLLERDGAIAIISINRPKVLNALKAGQLMTAARIAMRYIISAINAGAEMPLARAYQHEATLVGLVASTDNMREGTGAFLDKRKPQFKGR